MPQALKVAVISKVSSMFSMPPNPYDTTKAQKVYVAVAIKGVSSKPVAFQYTLTKAMTADFKGKVATASGACYAEFWSDPVYGEVYYKGITDTETTASKKLRAQIGYGPSGTDPGSDVTWKWFDATFKQQRAATGTHVYEGKLKLPLVKTYAVAYRFSYEATGLGPWGEWIYADKDDSDLTYATADEATLTSSAAPTGFCQVDGDCMLERYKNTCDLSGGAKAARCVECLKAADCKNSKYFKGTQCSTSKKTCYCTASGECKGSLNGEYCWTQYGFCGCKGDSDCPKGVTCDTNYGLCP